MEINYSDLIRIKYNPNYLKKEKRDEEIFVNGSIYSYIEC